MPNFIRGLLKRKRKEGISATRPSTPLLRVRHSLATFSLPYLPFTRSRPDPVQNKAMTRGSSEHIGTTTSPSNIQLTDALAPRPTTPPDPIPRQPSKENHDRALASGEFPEILVTNIPYEDKDQADPREELGRLRKGPANEPVEHGAAKFVPYEEVEMNPLQSSKIQLACTLLPTKANSPKSIPQRILDDHSLASSGLPFESQAGMSSDEVGLRTTPMMVKQEGSSSTSINLEPGVRDPRSYPDERTSDAFHAAQANVIIEHNQLSAGRDLNQIITVTASKHEEPPILRQLRIDLNPISTAEHDSYEADQRSKCFENTRVQVLNDIQAWITGEGNQAPIYVLDGVAGIGKSTIAQTVAERAAKAKILGASFFYTRNEAQRMTAKYFFPTIAFQLARYHELFARQVAKVLEQHPDAAQKSINQQLSLLILEPLQHLSIPNKRSILVVIDALDECQNDEANILLTLLAQNIRHMPQLKIFITTRPEWHLRTVLDRDGTNHELFRLHAIEDTIVHSDIRLYLNHFLSIERVRALFPNRQPLWQPTPKEMEMLCGVCGTLFIVASTAEKFIFDTKRMNPGKQLARLLAGVSPTDFSGSKHTDVMDRFYIQIIRSAAPDDLAEDDPWTTRYQTALGAIIILRTPLPCSALAALLAKDSVEIEEALLHLHSLVAPTGRNLVFRVHHKSFPDFITNKERIQRALGADRMDLTSKFVIDTKAHHRQLATACLRIMNENLKENVAGLNCREWYKDKRDILELKNWKASDQLAYAVKYWAAHLHAADKLDNELKQQLSSWTSNHILAWLEVMCILDLIGQAHEILVEAITRTEGHVGEWAEQATTTALLHDVMRLVLQSGEILKLSPMHVYWSTLPFAPKESAISGVNAAMGRLKALSGVEEGWSPMLATLSGHSDGVNAIAFSPNGTRLASASRDKTVRLWDGKTGAHIAALSGHSGNVSAVAFSPDSTRLASASDDNTVWLWDGKTGTHIDTLTASDHWHWHPYNLNINAVTVAFSPDGTRLALASNNNTVQLWNGKTGTHMATLRDHLYIPVAFSSDARLAFSPDDTTLALASYDRTVQLWDGKTGTHIATLSGHLHWVNAVAFSPGGITLASASWDKTVRLWDGKIGTHIATLSGHSDNINAIAFSPNGRRLASASSDKTVRLWDRKTATHIATLCGHSGKINAIAFSPSGRRLASASNDNTVRLWDGKTGAHMATLTGHSSRVQTVAFSPDGTRLASASNDNIVWLWDGKIGTRMHTLRGHSSYVTAATFSPAGSSAGLISMSNDKTVRLWIGKTGTQIATLSGHSSYFKAVAFSPDGTVTTLASASDDKTVQLWDGKTAAHIATLSGHSGKINAVAFSHNSTRVASASDDKTVRLWDGTTGAYIATLSGHSSHVKAVAFSPNGKRLASASSDKTVRLWDGKTGSHTHTLTGHSKSVNAVTFFPHGTRLASISSDNKIRFWNGRPNCCTISLTTLLTTKFTSILSLAFFPPTNHNSNAPADNAAQSGTSFRHLFAIAAVERKQPKLFGLIAIKILPGNHWQCTTAPICWFPPHLHVTAVSVHHKGSLLAVGCRDGKLLLLDISSVSLSF